MSRFGDMLFSWLLRSVGVNGGDCRCQDRRLSGEGTVRASLRRATERNNENISKMPNKFIQSRSLMSSTPTMS